MEATIRTLRQLLGPRGAPRLLSLSQLTSSVGDGLYYVCAALYFTRIVGLTPAQLGLGLTVAWTCGFFASIPLGHLADRQGPRRVATFLYLMCGLATASYLVVRSLPMFLVAATVYAVCSRGASAAQLALLAGVVDKEGRTKTRALLIAILNAGLAVGAGLGGLVLLADSEAAYLTAFGANSLSFVVAALLLSRLPSPPPPATQEPDEVRTLEVLRDKPFAVVAVLNAVLVLHLPLIDVALPLWIVRHTSAPLWSVSAIFVLNTVMVVFFQVRVARGVSDLSSATRVLRSAGLLLLAGCVAYAASAADMPSWAAAGILLLAAAVLTVGEMRQTVATTEISFGLSPEGRHGQYQAFFGMGLTAAEAVGPLLLTGLIVYGGWWGWVLLGGGFLLASLAMGPAVRWGERTRPLQPGGPAATDPALPTVSAP